MENASKALLIAGGVLIAILIITLAVRLFLGTGNVSKTYNASISQEEITTFNNNFTQYQGQDLTIHQVVSICNFARQNNTHKLTDTNIIGGYKTENINENIDNKFSLTILDYENGYVNKIQFIPK